MVNLSVEEPDALMRARPDLWEPRVATPLRPTQVVVEKKLDCLVRRPPMRWTDRGLAGDHTRAFEDQAESISGQRSHRGSRSFG
jgi:hypothetical protein